MGVLGLTQAERAQLAEDVAAAADRRLQLLVEAKAGAARPVAAGDHLPQDGELRLTDAYPAAAADGWSETDLTALGFQPAPQDAPSPRDSQQPG